MENEGENNGLTLSLNSLQKGVGGILMDNKPGFVGEEGEPLCQC